LTIYSAFESTLNSSIVSYHTAVFISAPIKLERRYEAKADDDRDLDTRCGWTQPCYNLFIIRSNYFKYMGDLFV